MGQPNSMPLLAAVANKGLWPIWALISLGGTVFPFLLCPVYINFISRMQLAWSLDRQVPEWFGTVNEKLRAPLNAILATLGLAAVFLFFQSYNALPHVLATTGNKLNLAGTAWFSIVMAILTWLMPGVNALLVRFRRPDLVRNAPFSKALPWLGLVWLVFPVWVYVFAVGKPIEKSLEGIGPAALPRDERHPRRAHLLRARPRDLRRDAAPHEGEGRRHEDAVHGDPARLVDARLYIASDFHAAEKAWRKFVNAIRLERLQGGRRAARRRPHRQGDRADRPARRRLRDGAVRRASHGARATTSSRSSSATSPTSATTRSSRRRTRPMRCRRDEAGRDVLLHRLMNERIEAWLQLATERLADSDVPLYLMPGNDDDFGIDPLLDRAEFSPVNADGKVLDLPGGLQLLACGWSNVTPWQTPREETEDELYARLDALAQQVRDPRRAVFMIHVPPHDSGLDTAPLLDENLRPTVSAGDVLRGPVGSTAVRRGDRDLPAAARRCTATSTSRAASARSARRSASTPAARRTTASCAATSSTSARAESSWSSASKADGSDQVAT